MRTLSVVILQCNEFSTQIFPLSIALLHFEKDNRHGLSNFLKLKFVTYCWEERNEFH
jgi:hypothetical protein